MNLETMTDEDLFVLRNSVNAEADKRIAKAELHNNLVNVLSNADSVSDADDAYEAAKAVVFTE